MAQIAYYDVKGVILDIETTLPIPNVFVSDSLGLTTTLSGEDGIFEISILDSSMLQFSHIGYKKLSLNTALFYQENMDTIYLDPLNEELEEIILMQGDYEQFKKDFLALDRDSFETNVTLPGVKQYKGPINLRPGGSGESGSLILGAVSNILNPKRRERKRVNRWMKKIKKRQEK